MRTTFIALIGLLAAFLFLSAQESAPRGSASQSSGMSMNDMMSCMSHCERTKTGMTEMSRMMADAEKSNDPAKMRSALERAQKSMSEMQSHMDSCMSMMHDHMGGMMKGNPKKQ